MRIRLIAVSTVAALCASLLIAFPAIAAASVGNQSAAEIETHALGPSLVWTATAQQQKTPARTASTAILWPGSAEKPESSQFIYSSSSLQTYSPRVLRVASPRAPPLGRSAVL